MEPRICWANTDSFDEADIVIIGVPDESQSHALRKGSSEAPDWIRRISNLRDTYTRKGKKSLGLPYSDFKHKVYDYGNITREKIDEVYDKIITKSKIPILIGGDHSISAHTIKSISKRKRPLSLVYFDAHPDFVGSTTNYYGSVFHDVLPQIDIKSSLQIGVRTPEKEELDNLQKHDVMVITPFEIAEKGIEHVTKSVLDRIGKNIYISFDMDCIDPAFAPGVSVPVPLGITNIEAVYLLRAIAKKGILGIDIMEVCPSYDIKDRTSHLASRMISEVISCC